MMKGNKMLQIMGNIFFWMKDRRRRRRYAVSWDGLLEIRFPDFHSLLSVKVADFSEAGACLHAGRIYLDERHLIASNPMPELKLKIFSPEGAFESAINIRWYRWSVENAAFEIGVEFKTPLHPLLTDRLTDGLRNLRHPRHSLI
ncbi:MAG: hypothetical protein BWK80_42130 [Desulfobacteraceae bacterium IS3]|nr:MAG: hypothetical protein BWK80_42130 [Desulfobacteraceae bacterium IS3]